MLSDEIARMRKVNGADVKAIEMSAKQLSSLRRSLLERARSVECMEDCEKLYLDFKQRVAEHM